MNHQAENSKMTINNLIDLLTKLKEEGLGEKEVVIPYTPPQTTIGSSPSVKIKNISPGIDWDHSYVFLTPEISLGVLSEEQKVFSSHLENQLSLLAYNVKKISSNNLFSAEERLTQIVEMTDRVMLKPHPRSKKPSP